MESQPVPNIDHLLTNIGRTAASQGEVSGNTLALGGSKLLSAPLVSAISIEQLLSHSPLTAAFKIKEKTRRHHCRFFKLLAELPLCFSG